jgi:hypothetical protein
MFQMTSRPASSARPPSPVTTSAWIAARREASREWSKPISRKEVIEVSSQNTNSIRNESAATSPCIAPMNIRMKEKNRP